MSSDTAACDTITLSSVHSFLKRNETQTESCPKVVSYTHDTGNGPVLFLVHGYPQSSFIWRHVAAHLKDRISLFIPELPGYGISSNPNGPISFQSMGRPLLEAAQKLFPNRPIVLGGHDRGARVMHRTTVATAHDLSFPPIKVLGCILLDIVPTLDQWKSFGTPAAVAAYFHWPFMTSDIAPAMILAFGGGKWARGGLERIIGANEAGKQSSVSDGAYDVYESLYARRETIVGSCADYKAAGLQEPQLQIRDQEEGKKIEVPTLVVWSLRGLGKMHGDVHALWKPWVKEGVELRAIGAGEEVGHYLPEEAHDFIASQIRKFLDDIGI